MKDSLDIIANHMQVTNRHLAKNKMGLLALLEEDRPKIRLRSGDYLFLDKKELEDIADIIPSGTNIQLPIYIEMSSDKYGPGTARIAGAQECRVVGQILEKEAVNDELFIFRPHVQILRKRLPTTTQYMFTVAPDL